MNINKKKKKKIVEKKIKSRYRKAVEKFSQWVEETRRGCKYFSFFEKEKKEYSKENYKTDDFLSFSTIFEQYCFASCLYLHSAYVFSFGGDV